MINTNLEVLKLVKTIYFDPVLFLAELDISLKLQSCIVVIVLFKDIRKRVRELELGYHDLSE